MMTLIASIPSLVRPLAVANIIMTPPALYRGLRAWSRHAASDAIRWKAGGNRSAISPEKPVLTERTRCPTISVSTERSPSTAGAMNRLAGRRPPRHHLGMELWGDDVRSYGERDLVGPRDHWVFVERWLTPPRGAWEWRRDTDLELGPRGSFRSDPYVSTRFIDRHLRPDSARVAEHPQRRTPRREATARWLGLHLVSSVAK